MKSRLLVAAFIAVTGLSAVCATSAVAENKPADYSLRENWLCRTGAESLGACDIDNTATIIAADGSMTKETWRANPNAPIDCFYVYPTVSLDTTPNSDLVAGPEEMSVVKQQFSRFGSQCRVFAPLYRQITLTALRAGMGGGEAMAVDRALGFNDVVDAWNYYLSNYNDGRGVVLVGHSQGSGVLTRLIQDKIEGETIQQQIISALLIGTNVQVPKGEIVGATFKHMPLCAEGDQTRCIVTYASFRSTVPPPPNSLFGRGGNNTQSACTNPARLAKSQSDLHAYLNADGSRAAVKEWVKGKSDLGTPFASLPGLLSGECVSNERGSYLEITVHGDSVDPRTDDIAGDVTGANGEVQANWGLHLIDVNLAMGDLVKIVERQSKAYLSE
jgi:hypothetical protein